MNSEVLKNAGIDVEKGVTRFLGDRQLFENILLTFLEDETFNKGKNALKKEDYKDLYECIHTLKGVAGNTDMTQLFRTTGVLCDYLRKNQTVEVKEVNSLFNEVEEAYHSVLAGIIAAREV
ncbi:Hpt domain-containing protein [Anaerotignum sp. MB30-C6]|uniref:Hpt domain-containing protein n=1 Tax=Anaerotignum sp. MB30-C6 TaxID=3070814 RepID=UPI0027DAF5D3|nr:Hpt domain-containing protein [Anaerotignum sp. MB30-C6]WMI82326.1 Hpt domain-containing protein [Anaerotignum sp. MB30-C6]